MEKNRKAKANPMGIKNEKERLLALELSMFKDGYFQLHKTKVALEESEKKYRSLMDAANELVLIAQDDQIKYANKKAQEVLGYSPSELLGRSVTDLIHPDDRDMVYGRYKRRIAGKKVISRYEFRMVDSRNAVHWVFAQPTRIEWEGHPATLNLLTDITERKKIDEKLFESEKRYRSLFDTANLMIQSVDADGRYKFVNREWQKKLGYSQKELAKLSFMDVVKDTECEHCMNAFDRLRKGENLYGIETVFVAKNGREIDVQGNIRPILEKGKFISTIGFFMDVSERKKSEQALSESLSETQLIFDEGPIGMAIVGLDNRFQRCNKSFCLFLGYSEKEMKQKSIADITFPDDAEIGMPDIQAIVAGKKKIATVQKRYVRKDGTVVWGEVTINLVRDGQGRPLYLLPVIRDITERKAMEKALAVTTHHLTVISECDQALVHAENEQDLLSEICRIVCEKAGYKMAWVGFALNDPPKTVQPVASYGTIKDYLKKAKIVWSNIPRGRGPTGTAIRTSKIIVNQDFETNPRLLPWRSNARKLGFRSSAVFPLLDESGKSIGALNIYSEEPNVFSPEAIQPLKELTDDLAFGLLNLRIRAQRKQAEEALRLSEQKYRRFYETLHDAYVRVDMTGRVVESNALYRKMLGYSEKELSKLKYTDITPKKWHSIEARILKRQILRRGYSEVYEKEYRRKDGTLVPIEIKTFVLHDRNGKPESMWAIVRDITERQIIENELRESRFNLSLALQSADMGVWHLDIAENKRYFDEQVCHLLGIHPKKFKGTSSEFFKVLHPDDAPKVKEALVRTIRQGASYAPEYRVIWPDGSVHHIAVRGKLVRTADGRPSRINGIIWDITERKKAEEAIADLARFPNENPNPIIRIRPNGEVLFENGAAKKYFKNFNESVYRAIKSQVRKSYQTDRILEVEINAEDRYFLFSIAPFRDLGYLNLYARDITLRKRAESLLRKSEREINELVDTANSVIIRWASDGKIKYINSYGLRMFGYNQLELIGENVSVLVPKTESSGRDMRNYLKDIARHPDKYALTENENIRKNGELFWVSWTNKVIKDESGEFKEILAIGNDISERMKMEAQLSQSESRYHSLFENMQEGFAYCKMLYDRHGKPEDFRYLMVNPAFEELTGLKDVTGKKASEVIPGIRKGNPEIFEAYHRVTTTGKPEKFESYSPGFGGWLAVSAFRAGEKGCFVAVFDNVTARKESEQHLKDSELRYRTLSMRQQSILGAVPDILMEVNNRKIYTWANQAGIDFFGKSVIGQTASHYFEGKQKVYKAVKPLFSGKDKTIYLESWQKRKDGQNRLLAWWCKTLKDKNGKVIGALSSARDITDQRKIEDGVKVSELRYRRLFESAKDGILILDYNTGMVVDVNPFLTKTLGLQRFRLIGKQLWQLGFFKDIVQNKANFLELKRKKIIRYENLPMETADGRKLHVEFVSNVYDAGGFKVIQCNVRDITERWKMEELKNQFLDITTHELKTPLIPIRSQCQSLLEGDYGPLAPRQKEAMEMIYRRESQMEKMVTDILDLSKARSNSLNLALEKTNLDRVLRKTVDNVADIAKNKGIDFDLKIPVNLPHIPIDSKRIAQVIDNLLSNALKNTPDNGSIHIKVHKMDNALAVSVRDTGIGMGKDVIKQLFTPFFQADKTAARKFGGAGLGLAISKGIVEAHGGKIWAESQGKNKGSTLTFTLPLKNGRKIAFAGAAHEPRESNLLKSQ